MLIYFLLLYLPKLSLQFRRDEAEVWSPITKQFSVVVFLSFYLLTKVECFELVVQGLKFRNLTT